MSNLPWYYDIFNPKIFENERKESMTKEQIVKLAVENNLVAEVYDTLHYIMMAKLGVLQDKSDELNTELRLVKKFADANKLDVIKDILTESEDKHISREEEQE